ncbi:Glyoxalase 3 [Vanrija pseudolonga]|uniref:D-lactate dehydratase n=1 Tax=Vanrija pseudolonga TaxID=143232 RepID=A0AAF0Y522_9TREE|nr:Glyoxalase 3 [Vanrija pseudolonga]
MPLPQRAIIALTSQHTPLYKPDGNETGAFITEALDAFKAFTGAGFEVVFASESGDYTPDWLSLQPEVLSDADREVYEDTESPFRSALDNLYAAADLSAPDGFGILFASGGHAALTDLPDAKGLQALASGIYSAGGVLAAVSHGGVLFTGVKANGKPVTAGKKVTGFTDAGEAEEGVLDVIKTWDRPTAEQSLKAQGAEFVAPPSGRKSDAFIQVDGRVVTGANYASAGPVAEAAIKVFKGL